MISKRDPECRRNVWDHHEDDGKRLKATLRSYISLSQKLLYDNRVFPPHLSAGPRISSDKYPENRASP